MRPAASAAWQAAPTAAGRTPRGAACKGPRDRVPAICSCAPFPAEQPGAYPPRSDIDDEDGEDDHHQNGADIRVIELEDGHHEFLSDAAGADKTHHRGAAHIDLEPQQGVAG